MRCSVTGSKRRGLSDFLGKELKSSAAHPAPPPPAKSVSTRVPKSVSSRVDPPAREVEVEVEVSPALERAVTLEVTDSGSDRVSPEARAQTLEVTDSGSDRLGGVPPYLRLTRKEVRFREAQLDVLDRTVRRLMRARRGGGERITENTLVRVAVDLLLERADELTGATEAELLRSLRRK